MTNAYYERKMVLQYRTSKHGPLRRQRCKKKLTITVDERVYHGLHTVIGLCRISRFIESLVRPYVLGKNLEAHTKRWPRMKARRIKKHCIGPMLSLRNKGEQGPSSNYLSHTQSTQSLFAAFADRPLQSTESGQLLNGRL